MEEKNDIQQYRRFFRDGAPYIDNFESVASLLMGKQKQQDLFISTTMHLIRSVHDHLAQCQVALGNAEQLIEDARDANGSEKNIKDHVQLCCDLQKMQTKLVDDVVQCMNGVIENVLPR